MVYFYGMPLFDGSIYKGKSVEEKILDNTKFLWQIGRYMVKYGLHDHISFLLI